MKVIFYIRIALILFSFGFILFSMANPVVRIYHRTYILFSGGRHNDSMTEHGILSLAGKEKKHEKIVGALMLMDIATPLVFFLLSFFIKRPLRLHIMILYIIYGVFTLASSLFFMLASIDGPFSSLDFTRFGAFLISMHILQGIFIILTACRVPPFSSLYSPRT